jgi:hypothetical protein
MAYHIIKFDSKVEAKSLELIGGCTEVDRRSKRKGERITITSISEGTFHFGRTACVAVFWCEQTCLIHSHNARLHRIDRFVCVPLLLVTRLAV